MSDCRRRGRRNGRGQWHGERDELVTSRSMAYLRPPLERGLRADIGGEAGARDLPALADPVQPLSVRIQYHRARFARVTTHKSDHDNYPQHQSSRILDTRTRVSGGENCEVSPAQSCPIYTGIDTPIDVINRREGGTNNRQTNRRIHSANTER